jgi:vacuolar-type H+-ATPase subunit H
MIQTWHLYAVGAVAVTAVAWVHGYGTGRSLEGQEFAEYRAKVESAQQVLQAENERIRRKNDEISKDAAAGFEAATHAHSGGAGRIRVQQCPGGGAKVPAAAHVAGEPGAASAERRLDSERDEALSVSAERCEEIANRAVMDAAQVLHLQAFYNGIRAAYGVEEYP